VLSRFHFGMRAAEATRTCVAFSALFGNRSIR
jgi:hypothetical protein